MRPKVRVRPVREELCGDVLMNNVVLFWVFPDGQEIAIRLNKKIKEASGKLDKLITEYNKIPSPGVDERQKLERDHVFDMNSDLYRVTNGPTVEQEIPIHVRKQMVELAHRFERCREELQYIQTDKENVLKTFQSELNILQEKLCVIELSLENENCKDAQLMRGKAALVRNEIDFVAKRLNELTVQFSNTKPASNSNSESTTPGNNIEMDAEEREEVLNALEWYEKHVSQRDYLTVEDTE